MSTQVDAATERHRLISDRLEAVGRVEVVDLACRLDVAQETIRRDLRLLEQQGVLQRVHGGAVRRAEPPLSPFDGTSPPPADRHVQLAEKVARALPRGGVIFLGASPILAAVADALARQSSATPGTTTIVTTSLDAAVTLSRVPQLAVVNLGGTVDRVSRAQQGDWALDALDRLRFALAVLPADGVHATIGVSMSTTMSAAMAAKAASVADRVWLAVEPEAIGRRDLMQAIPVTRLERLLVAGQAPLDQVTAFAEAGIALETIDAP